MCVQTSLANPAGLFIHKDGRWLRLDASGRLQGERLRPRFFYLRRGQLKEARTRRVLRHLTSTRAIGPPLHTVRRQRVVRTPPPAPPPRRGPSPTDHERAAPGKPQPLVLADSPSILPSVKKSAPATSGPKEPKLTQASTSHVSAHNRPKPPSSPKAGPSRINDQQPTSSLKSRSSRHHQPSIKQTEIKYANKRFGPTSSSTDKETFEGRPGPLSSKGQRKKPNRLQEDSPSSSEEFHTKIIRPAALRPQKTGLLRQTRNQLRKSSSEETLDLLESLKLIPIAQLSQLKSQSRASSSPVLRPRPGPKSSKSAPMSSNRLKKKVNPRRSLRTLDLTLSSDESNLETSKNKPAQSRKKRVASNKPGPLSTKMMRSAPSPQTKRGHKKSESSSDSTESLSDESESSSDDSDMPYKKNRPMSNGEKRPPLPSKRAAKPRGTPGEYKKAKLQSSQAAPLSSEPKHSRSSRSESPCKELLITLEEVSLVARWLEKNPRALPPHVHDADRFRTDEGYRGQVLFRLQPLVTCKRLPLSQTTALLRRAQRAQTKASIAISNSDIESESDKENRKRKRDGTTSSSESERDSDSAPTKSDKKRKRAPAALKQDGNNRARIASKNHFKRPAVRLLPPHPRAFAPQEDRSIVMYVLEKRLESQVNGNGMWKRLQPLWKERCGVVRSWHSLRNRYLRYLLPSLHQLALSPADAQRLRAAAATGSLKLSRKRRNSLLDRVGGPTRSAWSRRPRPRGPASPSPPRSPRLQIIRSQSTGTRSSGRRNLDSSR